MEFLPPHIGGLQDEESQVAQVSLDPQNHDGVPTKKISKGNKRLDLRQMEELFVELQSKSPSFVHILLQLPGILFRPSCHEGWSWLWLGMFGLFGSLAKVWDLTQSDKLSQERLHNVLALVLLGTSIVFSIHIVRTRAFYLAVTKCSAENIQHIRYIYRVSGVALFLILLVWGVSSEIPAIVYYNQQDPNRWNSAWLPLFIISQVLQQVSLSVAISLFCVLCQLQKFRWNRFNQSIHNLEFRMETRQVMREHDALCKQLQSSNLAVEKFVAITTSLGFGMVVTEIYSVIQPGIPDLVWSFRLAHSVSLLFVPLIVGSFLTSRAGRGQKLAAQARAALGTEETSQQLDSLVMYFLSSPTGFKIFGVLVDFGFVAKMTLAAFTICAFVVQRTLTSEHK